MTIEQAKRSLSRIPSLERRIEYKQREVERIEALIERVTPVFRQDVLQGGRKGSIDDNIDKLSAARESLNQLLGELAECWKVVNARLSKIEDEKLQQILVLRYIEEMEWKDVAAAMHYSESTVLRQNRKALRAYARQF
jgi:DNA-directed RNA polymerase specialized sigma subunit